MAAAFCLRQGLSPLRHGGLTRRRGRIGVCCVGVHRLRANRPPAAPAAPTRRRIHVAPSNRTELIDFSLGKHFYPKEGRYFLGLNNGPAKEISKVEYDELVRDAYEFFARLWVLFSCTNVCLWGYILGAESERSNAG